MMASVSAVRFIDGIACSRWEQRCRTYWDVQREAMSEARSPQDAAQPVTSRTAWQIPGSCVNEDKEGRAAYAVCIDRHRPAGC